jgi:hypothetical protein
MALEKAVLTNLDSHEFFTVLFNPGEYTVNKDINYAQASVPGLSSPILQFVNGNMKTLEMELLVDTYETHFEGSRQVNRAWEDVRTLTRKITNLMSINPRTHAPPVVMFTWGSVSFTGVLARVNQRFTMFLPDGTPVRARLQVAFNEYRNAELEAKEIKRETADYSKLYVVGQEETLSNIAYAIYGDPALWRPIAIHNKIDNPHVLPVGTRLLVPKLPFRDPKTGEIYQ